MVVPWEFLDGNPVSVSIAAAGADLYQLHGNGEIYHYAGTPAVWRQLDHNPATKQIAAADGNLYQLHGNGEIWHYTGTPITGWQQLDHNPAAVAVVAAGPHLYQLHDTGKIWRYTGPPITGWQLLDQNPATTQVAAAGDDLYQLHDDGTVWHFTGTPITGWQQLDRNPATKQIVAADGNLYQLHGNGEIWHYTGTPITGWRQLDHNPATTGIAAAGDELHQIHGDGTVWRYTGVPVTGWELLDAHGAKQIVAAGDDLYQIRNDGGIWKAGEPARLGQWDPVFRMENVAIHTSLLPNGKVLYVGRRDTPDGTLDEHECTPQVWDPATRTSTATPQPTLADGTKINIFCAGHAFLPDGRLLVAGGHTIDGDGLDQACLYDFRDDTWTPLPVMNKRRWYPTVTALPDGTALVLSGSYKEPQVRTAPSIIDDVPQIWDGNGWRSLPPVMALELYPRLHVVPDGTVFMSGPGPATSALDTAAGTWTPPIDRGNGLRDFAPSVMVEPGRIVYFGGGNDVGPDGRPVGPTAATEAVDLNAGSPAWRTTRPMLFPRRQHNGAILPDGSVLITGGTRGPGFNNLDPGNPVHVAELYEPASDTWTVLAAEDVDRCYHATTVLLPDATVLSAGSGEFAVDGNATPNAPEDTHRDAQIFHPPYLFRGPRPVITSAPEEIGYGATFTVETSGPDVATVTWIRLASVTHAFDENQLIDVLEFSRDGARLTVTAPGRPEISPPGHYMLFVLSPDGVPSVARIVRIGSAVPTPAPALAAAEPEAGTDTRTLTETHDEHLRTHATGTPVTVGLTPVCPYGLGACWGGAYRALNGLDGVADVRPIADNENSTAVVYLRDQGLPDLGRWPDEFARSANGSYVFRGVEIAITGAVRETDGVLRLAVPAVGTPLTLTPIRPEEKVQWDRWAGRPRELTDAERSAYRSLAERSREPDGGGVPVRVTGPLTGTDGDWALHVREFEVVGPG